MKTIYILRHGHSEHLKGGFHQRISAREYVHSLLGWETANLTEQGRREAASVSDDLRKTCKRIISSPLTRTLQTARIVAGDAHKVKVHPLLKEIDELPWRLPSWLRLREMSWFYVIFLLMLIDGRVAKLLHEAGCVLRQGLCDDGPTLMVTHKARIISLLVYARIHPRWRVVTADLEPAGVSMITRV